MALLFFLSGALALVYEVLWQRRFALVFGSGAPASAAVLAATFAGLGLGSLVLGRAAARWRRPLRVYAVLEAVIGGGAVLTGVIIAGFDGLYPRLHEAFAGHPWAFVFAKTLLAFVALAVPTFAMGGTVPVLAGWVDRGQRHLGVTAGLLYVANTAGAGVGALAVPFLLLPAAGASGSLTAAVAGNLGLAAAALLLDRREVVARAPASALPRPDGRAPGEAAILVLALVSGLVTFALQVSWNRAFAQVHENSVHAFAVVAATFILALAAGGALARLALRRGTEPSVVARAAWVAGALAVAVGPALFAHLTAGLDYLGAADAQGAAWRLIRLALPTVFLPAALLGMALPALMEGAGRLSSADPGRVLGRVLGANVAGCVAGALLAGFWLPGVLGLWRSMGVMALLTAAAAAFVPRAPGAPAGRGRWAPAAAMVVAAAAMVAVPPRVRLATGGGQRLVSVEEGTHGVVAVVEEEGSRSLKLNNWYLLGGAASAGDERRQGHIPLLLHPAPRRVAFLGLGSGITASSALFHPVESVTVVELVPEVAAAAAAHLGDANRHLLRDPRTRLVVDDARSYLRGTRERFDVIVGDLVVPWRPGESALFTLEHFLAARRALAPGGVFAQWLPLFQLSEAELVSITRAFLSVFPEASVWRGDFSPRQPVVALLARPDGGLPEPGVVAARIAQMRADPANVVLALPGGLWAYAVGGVTAGDFAAHAAPVNREDDPWVELGPRAGRGPRLDGRGAHTWLRSVRRRSPPLSGLGAAEEAAIEAGEHLYAFSLALSEDDEPAARAAHARLITLLPEETLAAAFSTSPAPAR